MAEDFPLGAIVGISVGGAVLVIGLGVLAIWAKTRGSKQRNSKDLHGMVMMRRKISRKKPVLDVSGQFDNSNSYDVQDVFPPRGSYEQDVTDSFVMSADAFITTRESYDRPYTFGRIPNPETTQSNSNVSGYGEVSIISQGRPQTSTYSMRSTSDELENSQMRLLPNQSSHIQAADRPPIPLPTRPAIVYVQQPISRSTPYKTNTPVLYTERPDSFLSSNAVDLGAQPQKAWMLSSLETDRFAPHRRY